jgi:hypothetical protein
MNRRFFHIDFLNESETEELCKQKIKGWLFCVFDENENPVVPKFEYPYNYLLHNIMIDVTKSKRPKIKIKQEHADLLMKRSKK